jgi:hypothetical protein
MVMKQMIKSYNFKPFLSKTASFCYWEQVRCRRRRRRRRRRSRATPSA